MQFPTSACRRRLHARGHGRPGRRISSRGARRCVRQCGHSGSPLSRKRRLRWRAGCRGRDCGGREKLPVYIPNSIPRWIDTDKTPGSPFRSGTWYLLIWIFPVHLPMPDNVPRMVMTPGVRRLPALGNRIRASCAPPGRHSRTREPPSTLLAFSGSSNTSRTEELETHEYDRRASALVRIDSGSESGQSSDSGVSQGVQDKSTTYFRPSPPTVLDSLNRRGVF